jgi:hypothetical protein
MVVFAWIVFERSIVAQIFPQQLLAVLRSFTPLRLNCIQKDQYNALKFCKVYQRCMT